MHYPRLWAVRGPDVTKTAVARMGGVVQIRRMVEGTETWRETKRDNEGNEDARKRKEGGKTHSD